MNLIPRISQLSPRIIRVLGCNPGPMTLQGTNTYIIGTGQKRILLDTGDGQVPEYLDLLKSIFQEKQVTLEHIILTHWHPDHIGGVNAVIAAMNNVCRVSKLPIEEKPTTFDKLVDGEEIQTEGASLRVYHTPGHSSDHIVLHMQEENAVFSGDCILGEGTAVFEDLFDYMKSLETILNIEPDVIYPGHGPVIQDPVPRIKYYISHRNARENQILQYLQENSKSSSTALDIVKGVYKDIDPQLYQAAEHNVKHHLHKLEKEGKVKCDGNLWICN